MPPIPGLAEVGAWSNRQITTSKEVPARLLILGGGVVGVEMAQAWSSFGSHVTIIEARRSLLANEEPFVGDEVGEALSALGAVLLIGAKAVAVRRDDSGITVELEDGSLRRRRPAAGRGRPQAAERRARACRSVGLPDDGYRRGR